LLLASAECGDLPAREPDKCGLLPVTVVIPVKNAERNLRACLAELDAFLEVVVVDSHSSDATEAIARQAGAKVVQFSWNGSFPKKRNWVLQTYSFRTAWALFLDADEIVTPEFVAELRTRLRNTEHAGFWLRYRTYFIGQLLNHGVEQRKLALFRIGAGSYERIDEVRWSDLDMEVHEHPVLTGSIDKIHAPLEHKDLRGLHDYIARHNEYSTWEARRYLALRADVVAWSHLTRRQKLKYSYLQCWWFAPSYFIFVYIIKRGFSDGWAGLVYTFIKMEYYFQIYFKVKTLAKHRSAHEQPSRGDDEIGRGHGSTARDLDGARLDRSAR
jgi:glycosyltransferase involved in cell wall biosynthesis